MFTKSLLTITALNIFLTFQVAASAPKNPNDIHDQHHEQEQSGHKAHQHGVSEIHIAQDNNTVMVEVLAPGFDLFGFENPPNSLDEKIAFNRAMTILKNPRTLFAFNEDAECDLISKKVKFSSNTNNISGHGEVFANYKYNCDKPEQLTDIKLHWFKSFQQTKEVKAFSLTDKGSKTGVITEKSRRLYF